MKAADGAEAAVSHLDQENEWKKDVWKERDREKEVCRIMSAKEHQHARTHTQTHRLVLVPSETIFNNQSSDGIFITNDDDGDEAKCW